MARSFIFDAQAVSRFYLGSEGSKGFETPKTRMCIDVTECTLHGRPGETEGVEVVQIWLTVPQMAELVKMFFRDVVVPGNIFTSLLQRLLRKRWKTMSSPVATCTFVPDREPWFPSYDKINV